MKGEEMVRFIAELYGESTIYDTIHEIYMIASKAERDIEFYLFCIGHTIVVRNDVNEEDIYKALTTLYGVDKDKAIKQYGDVKEGYNEQSQER
jgi:hypothetical protein